MERIPLDVFSSATNRAIIRAPGRHFPGVLVQGDTLSSLVALAREIAERARATTDEELIDASAYLADELGELISHYEQVLREHNMRLPY